MTSVILLWKVKPGSLSLRMSPTTWDCPWVHLGLLSLTYWWVNAASGCWPPLHSDLWMKPPVPSLTESWMRVSPCSFIRVIKVFCERVKGCISSGCRGRLDGKIERHLQGPERIFYLCHLVFFFYIFTDDRTRKENIDLISISLFNNYSTSSWLVAMSLNL